MDPVLILNDRDLLAAKSDLQAVLDALSSENTFRLAGSGISVSVIRRHTEMLHRRQESLQSAIRSYESLKAKNSDLLNAWRSEPGVILVLARIYRGLSQKQVAQKLGMREQQIQRYEADRYRSISLSNFKRICTALGVSLTADVNGDPDEAGFFIKPDKLDPNELRRVLTYVRKEGWLSDKQTSLSDEEALGALVNYATSTRDRFGGPALFRKSAPKAGQLGALSLHVWRARVVSMLEQNIEEMDISFDPTDISWLTELVKLSTNDDGPLRAIRLLNEHGIAVAVVSAVPGTGLDGAAFLERGVPVIALTLRYDRTDYFWFTLLHELGHVFLHLHDDLAGGFFDDFENESLDSLEQEANDFAASVIVPPELWRLSPARIAKTSDAVEQLARKLEINSALIFGKIRRERNDYKVFSKEVGQGAVRKLFGL